MTEELKDANNEENAGSSPDVQREPTRTEDGLISTTEFVEVEKDSTEADTDETDISDGDEQKTPEPEAEKKKDFHEHKDFKKLVDKKNTYKEVASKVPLLERELNELRYMVQQQQQPSQQQPTLPFSDTLAMEADDLLETFTENPHEFLGKFADQIRYEVAQSLRDELSSQSQQRQTEAAINRQLNTFNEFFEKNADAKSMWESGELTQFMNQNPGHNAISAYHSLNNDKLIESAKEKAVREALEKQNKQLTAAGRAGSFSSPASQPSLGQDTSELKAPDKHGGKEAVMLRRWLARSA